MITICLHEIFVILNSFQLETERFLPISIVDCVGYYFLPTKNITKLPPKNSVHKLLKSDSLNRFIKTISTEPHPTLFHVIRINIPVNNYLFIIIIHIFHRPILRSVQGASGIYPYQFHHKTTWADFSFQSATRWVHPVSVPVPTNGTFVNLMPINEA